MPDSSRTSPQAELSAALAAIWQRNQPQVQERLALLERAAAADPLPRALQQEAAATAHKLAGTLGMFGFAQGTDLARELEQQFELEHPDASSLTTLTQRLRASIFPQQPG